MVEITGAFLSTLNTGVNMRFNQYLEAAPSQYASISMMMDSTGRENFYPKLDEIPGLREWIGERVVHSMSTTAFAIANKTFELTLGIDRDDMEDDQFGLFNIGMAQLGKEAAILPDKLVFGALKAGASTLCYDGQNFFDYDHVSYTPGGVPVAYANVSTPQGSEVAGPAWFLFDTTRPIKPMIFQRRRPFVITPRVQLTDEVVYRHKRFEWGTDGRCAAGFGLWQCAYMSTRPLTMASYGAARAAMGSLRRLDGAPLGITPDLLMVPPTLEGTANVLLKNELVSTINTDGVTFTTISNPWRDTARGEKVVWLA